MAAAQIINAAVLAAALDGTVDGMARALLERTPYALAFAKRAANRVHAERFNLTFDLAWSYELLTFFQQGQHVDERGAAACERHARFMCHARPCAGHDWVEPHKRT